MFVAAGDLQMLAAAVDVLGVELLDEDVAHFHAGCRTSSFSGSMGLGKNEDTQSLPRNVHVAKWRREVERLWPRNLPTRPPTLKLCADTLHPLPGKTAMHLGKAGKAPGDRGRQPTQPNPKPKS